MRAAGLVLCAGFSRRMGDFKPLMPVKGTPLVVRTVASLLVAVPQVTVVTGHRGGEVAARLKDAFGTAVRVVVNPQYQLGDMFSSVKVGVAALPSCQSFFLLPGDMPAVTAATLHALLGAWRENHVVFPTTHDRRGHPPLIAASLIPPILDYGGDDGLRGFWRCCQNTISCPVADPGIFLDADSPPQLEQLVAYCDET